MNLANRGRMTAHALVSQISSVLARLQVRLVSWLFLSGCCAGGAWAGDGQQDSLIVLTNAAQIRSLSLEEAARKHPVRIQGVITHYDRRWSLNIQDKTAGIYIWTVGKPFDIEMGQLVEVEGVSGPGAFVPQIDEPRFRVIGQGAMPEGREVSLDEMMTGSEDCQWVQLRGVVRSVTDEGGDAVLDISAMGGRIKAYVYKSFAEAQALDLVDAEVRLSGVGGTRFNNKRQLVGAMVLVPRLAFVVIERPAQDASFTLSRESLPNLLRFRLGNPNIHRVRVQGIVTLRLAGGSFYLQDGSEGIYVQSSQKIGPHPGDRVDVVGFPAPGPAKPVMQDAIWLKTGTATLATPNLETPERALSGECDSTLIRLEGWLADRGRFLNQEVLFLRSSNTIFEAHLEGVADAAGLGSLRNGSRIQVSGVCATTEDASTFRILLRSPSDVAVLEAPPRWTIRHTFWVLGGVAAVLFASLVWVGSLRKQVRERTSELNEEIDLHKRTEVMLESEIVERKRMEIEVEKTYKELVVSSRQAGMAEVATGVLHNVGNVLNSVNVSSTLVAVNIKKSKAANLSKVVKLMREHEANLGDFFTNDPKGKQLPGYLAQLAEHLAGEQQAALQELTLLQNSIEHIKDIVTMQQSYAKISGQTETLKLSDLVEDALRMNASGLARHDVAVVKQFEEVPLVATEKHKVLQILVNLIRNAKYACDDGGRSDKRITVRVSQEGGHVQISVQDNGIGIPAENLARIFGHGFTTRKDGHGFGLHSGALAAKEMAGSLSAHSDGVGQGATFILKLPIESQPAIPEIPEIGREGESNRELAA